MGAKKPTRGSMQSAVAVRRTVRRGQPELDSFTEEFCRGMGDLARQIGSGSLSLTLLEHATYKKCSNGRPLNHERTQEIAATLEERLREAGFNGQHALQVRVNPKRPLDFFGNDKKLAIPVLPSQPLLDSREIIKEVMVEETGRFRETMPFDPHISFAEVVPSEETERVVHRLMDKGLPPEIIVLNGILIDRNWSSR